MRPIVIATRALPEPSLSTLEPDFEVHVLGYTPSELDLATEVPEAAALITLVSDPVTRKVLEAGKRLKIVANYAVGVDNVDLAAAATLGIAVTHTPDALTDATADLTIALLLVLARRILEGDRLVRMGGFSGWSPDLLLGSDLKGKTLGIVGPGRIGQAVARRARAFGMRVIAFGRSLREERDSDLERVSFEDLLRRSDVVSLHIPMTEETRGLFSGDTFSKMKRGSILLNTARGPLVEESALLRALDSGQLAAAGLDVYENEPMISPGLLDNDKVVLMPHAGSATVETRLEMARMVVEDVRRALSGESPLRPVAPEAGPRERLRVEG